MADLHQRGSGPLLEPLIWERAEPGWYHAEDDSASICREDDGRWYLYIEPTSAPKEGAACGHRTLAEAKACYEDRRTWKGGLTLGT